MTETVTTRDKGYRHLNAWHDDPEHCPCFPDDADTREVPKDEAEQWGLISCSQCDGTREVENYDGSYQRALREAAND